MDTSDNRNEFRAMLRDAIGRRRKQDVAYEIGIAPATLSRMLNDGGSDRPSRKTLQSIARVLPSLDLQELYRVCGYTDENTCVRERRLLPAEQRTRLNVQDLMRGFQAMKSDVRLFQDTEEIGNVFNRKYAHEVFEFLYSPEHGLSPDSELFCSAAEARWKAEDTVTTMYFVLYYYKTGHGIILQDIAFDCMRLAGEVSGYESIRSRLRDCPDFDMLPCLCVTESRGTEPEIHMIDTLFRRGIDEMVCTVSGYGFYLDNLIDGSRMTLSEGSIWSDNSSLITDFFRNHPIDSDDSSRRQNFQTAAGSTVAIGDRLGNVIAEIMTKETGIRFRYFPAEEHADWKDINRACIMAEDTDTIAFEHWSDLDAEPCETVREAAFRYASELGITQTETCFWQYRKQAIPVPKPVISQENDGKKYDISVYKT